MSAGISVAMATYNGARFVREQLESIASQTWLPRELVVCDDGSSDATLAILADFAGHAPFPVRIEVNRRNLGFANNFLHCASLCVGEWIAFCDQDDVWHPQKLELIGKAIAYGSDRLRLVYHVAELVDEELRPVGLRLPHISRQRLYRAKQQSVFWFVGGCVMCFHADLVRKIDYLHRPPDSYRLNNGYMTSTRPWMPHDKWICMLANLTGETAALKDVLTLYRRHAEAQTGSHQRVHARKRRAAAFSTGADEYRFLASVFDQTAASLKDLAKRGRNGSLCQELATGAAECLIVARLYAMRAALYTDGSVLARARTIVRLVRMGAYSGPRLTSFPLASLLKDLAHCVGILKLVRRPYSTYRPYLH